MLFSLPSVPKCQNSNWLLSLLLSDKIASFNHMFLAGELFLQQKDKREKKETTTQKMSFLFFRVETTGSYNSGKIVSKILLLHLFA